MQRNDRGTSLVPQRRQQALAPWEERDWLSPSGFFGASPWEMMRRMREDMNQVFGQFFGPSALADWGGAQGQQMWSPSIDISENDKEWTVEIDLPGVNRDNINVEVDHNQLCIRVEMRQETQEPPPQVSQGQQAQQTQQGQQGQQEPWRQYHRRERRYGYFERAFTLPENVDQENVRCDFRDGVLICHLPKTGEPAYRGRRIPIGEGAQTAISGQTSAQGQASAQGQPQATQQGAAGATPNEGKSKK
jgi:HSP20 family protein